MRTRIVTFIMAALTALAMMAAPAAASPPGCDVSGKEYAQSHIVAGNLGIETDFNIGKIGIDHKPGAHKGLSAFPFC